MNLIKNFLCKVFGHKSDGLIHIDRERSEMFQICKRCGEQIERETTADKLI
jgi:transcription elongation factor Elf1